MRVNILETIFSNSSKVGAFVVGMAAIISSATIVEQASIEADQFGFISFIMIATLMVFWGMSNWNVVENTKLSEESP